MKKLITILGIDEEICVFFRNEILKIFGDLFEVDYRNRDMEPLPPITASDLILYTDPEMHNEFISIIKCNAPTLMMKRTITREALRKIKSIPPGKSALVVNINQYMANETTALIYQLGVSDVTLYPYWEGKPTYPDVDYIINVDPRKYSFLPPINAEVIIIGHRVFDISSIIDILSILRVEKERSEEIIKNYMFKVPSFLHGLQSTYDNKSVMAAQLNILLDQLSNGVIVTDAADMIEFANSKSVEILGIPMDKLLNHSIYSLFSGNEKIDAILNNKELKDELIKYNGNDLVLSMKSVERENNYYGKIIMINPYYEMINTQQKIHKKIIGKGYYSKYDFSDLITNDPVLIRTKEICKQIASSDSTVLLLGESGTGKELFAGSIHNNSNRKTQPFVAINCATLPENLLESELFGYEEGAFTGAKKGGKIGLFELANKGTIFLDEIGDLPLNLQGRLLRALEEKEIMRVGGDSIISVDVRVIAATNRDLLKLVEEGKFRHDLFFRLNVFQITIPPLRKRYEDIKVITEHYLKKWNKMRHIYNDFQIFCNNYKWPGNVRELKNVLNYMTTISKSYLAFDNLPDYLRVRDYYVNGKHTGEELVLKLIYYGNKIGINTGRRTLHTLFNKIYYEISEMEIRKLIDKLSEDEKIEKNIGRDGNSITSTGIDFLLNNNYIREEMDYEFEDKVKNAVKVF
ncbi:sigma-54 interaction domain-containing protein [Lutispora thermophila]|uniref:Transcriptional regulator containing PAS, AAA-type ATPase, and DNA-binding Fis domains n=1 Tax=Lutispora thermophila DSM 19022 TaxID=1122184 RepID=A0A1M6J0F3_9FIRM|nr:sigma 54-interacting transcriptional regulator [Lutispora thermophila]SHJ40177.1 Transcriptional regulator containing PAS, AAA-type ATPase, and DNA-binding Fis domains [Lutispora thermophila DSM 19022]